MPEQTAPAAYTRPEPLPDTWLLCGECGAVTHEKWWTYWKYDDEGEQLIPIEDGDYDPIMRCPACKHDHRDDDGDSGVWDGTHDQMTAERRSQAPDMFDGWLATAEEIGARKGTPAWMLARFHEHPNALIEGTNTQALRRTLHQEEHEELMHELEQAAAGEADLEQIARELADVIYVTYGSAWAFGIDLDAAVAEVHRAAMDKMNAGLRRDDGKILKPPGFVPPDMTAAVRAAVAEVPDGQ